MPFVVDASVAICWLMHDEHGSIAEAAAARIAEDTAFVPQVWWFEIRNVLLVNQRRGRLDGQQANEALRLLRGLPVTVDTDLDEEALMRLARTHRLTAYDAAYLELAVRRALSLATLDGALATAAKAAGVVLIEGR